ncbi:universal stress protein [Longispora sp. K20-0274]|uniref:universal stress protein n=1 Tax=Longispora sp. K20-0274 TaxID=3088255 RepID=UPI00399ADE85
MEQINHRVVVGVDGSTGSHAAVEFAAAEAAARGVPLHLVCAFSPPVALPPPIIAPYPPEAPELTAPDPHVPDMLARLAEDTRRADPRLRVVDHVIHGSPAAVLLEESRHADLVVVGARGHGGFAELLAGSTATQVATHAACPVIVVRGTTTATGPVVVGVDATEQAHVACGFAFEEAVWRGVPVHAVHTFTPQVNEPSDGPAAYERAARLLTEALEGWRAKYPQVTVRESLMGDGEIVDALVDASDGACLVVAGSRGRGRFASLLLGSTSYALTHAAQCPVAITHRTT